MFLSTYENRIDKKGRVSVPASFRSYLSNLGYNGVICFPSFNNQSIESWPQNRVEKISNTDIIFELFKTYCESKSKKKPENFEEFILSAWCFDHAYINLLLKQSRCVYM